jgi:hypothetical protein
MERDTIWHWSETTGLMLWATIYLNKKSRTIELCCKLFSILLSSDSTAATVAQVVGPSAIYSGHANS